MKRLMLIILVALVVYSCEKNRCFYSTGKKSSLIISEEKFKTIAVWGLFDIELVQDSTYYVESFGGLNVINRTEAKVERDTLYLYNHNNCFWMRDYKRPLLKVHFSDIRHIDVNEASYIFSKDSVTDDFSLYVRGRLAETDLLLNNRQFVLILYKRTGGSYILRGETERLKMSVYYNAVCDASQLKADRVELSNNSIADCKINADSLLKYQIHGSGNVLLSGKPIILFDSVSSTGKLIYVD